MLSFPRQPGRQYRYRLIIVTILTCIAMRTQAQKTAEELAKELANPVANLISVPFQSNVDYGIGPHNGSRLAINIQPVVPIAISAKLNMITRYILPVISQRDITGANTKQDGLSDLTASAFFSPTDSRNGLIWGAGPVFLFPTGTGDYLSARKWGAGPTVLILKQSKGLTFGFLANQLWSVAGDDDRQDVNQLFFQPFLAYNWPSGAGLSGNAEMTRNWEAKTTATVLNLLVNGVTRLGSQTISLGAGPRVPLGGPSGSRPDLGLRAVVTLIFPQ